ncbi:hypothetical protein FRE64_08340 [Euhalothece natronophila Z-M001]|uniref:MotA/TolQ/ExbB proton channel domain-containing protein n=1 Tax=Euhalothece natronophila Z-M001 TaxID=522448 RepID=A0A5B8NN23_9CHRO|nr:hypothetical protein [Euhalothece natronophila]QDZ39951.1 hypothetical protein FRE64_08340 [Euhalothece natronophila Z-M001]
MYSNLFAQPPYLLLLFGLLISVTCGVAFQKVLKQTVQQWYKAADEGSETNVDALSVFIPFLGICGGIFAFLAAGLEIVINSWKLSGAIALPLTIVTGRLVWSQLKVLLVKLQEGGSQALDLDNIF